MKKMRRSIVFTAAIALATLLGSAPAFGLAQATWECTQLTSGGGGTWGCYDGSNLWYVDCGSGTCRYQRM